MNNYHKETGEYISIFDKVDFRTRNVTKPVHREDIIILYVHIMRASKYMKPKLIEFKGETIKSTFTAGDFSTSLSK